MKKLKLLAFSVALGLGTLSANASEVKCESEYRSYDGSCNNVKNVNWGAVGNYLEAGKEGSEYAADGVSNSITINEREISNTLMKVGNEGATVSKDGKTLMSTFYGQFLTHDIVATSTDNSNSWFAFGQMAALGMVMSPNFDINQFIGFMSQFDVPGVAIEDPRDELGLLLKSPAATTPYTGNIVNNVIPMSPTAYELTAKGKKVRNGINAWLDLSNVYGDTEEINGYLRSGVDGKLKVQDVTGTATTFTGQPTITTTSYEVLPFTVDVPPHLNTGNLSRPLNPNDEFASGDVRASENMNLLAIHTVFHRNHNDLAEEIKTEKASEIAEMTATEADEFIFQEARRINTAIYQHITINEYLTTLLGSQANLIKDYDGYDKDLKPHTNPTMTGAAFRYAHSQVPYDRVLSDVDTGAPFAQPMSWIMSAVQLTGQTGFGGTDQEGQGATTARNMMITYGGLQDVIWGLAKQPIVETDLKYEDSLRNIVFANIGSQPGIDLAAADVRRSRELGVPNFNKLREVYGYGSVYGTDGCYEGATEDTIECFSKITSDLETAQSLKEVYGKVNKVDGIIGLLAEDHVDGSPLPRTMAAIITEEFVRKRNSDRFWYENTMSSEEIAEIESISFADLLSSQMCGNGDTACTPKTAQQIDPDGDTVFKIPAQEAAEFEIVESGACKFVMPAGPQLQTFCGVPFTNVACGVLGGEFLGANRILSGEPNICPENTVTLAGPKDKIGTIITGTGHVRYTIYGDTTPEAAAFAAANVFRGLWIPGNQSFVDYVQENGPIVLD